ncbi:MAG: PAS domain-containing sensor histidine kinase [Planctomycetota bacterium]
MDRFWNLRTKFVAVLVFLLTGSFLLQSVIHEFNKERLLGEVVEVSKDIANEVGDSLERLALSRQTRGARGGVRRVPSNQCVLVTIPSRTRGKGERKPSASGPTVLKITFKGFREQNVETEKPSEQLFERSRRRGDFRTSRGGEGDTLDGLVQEIMRMTFPDLPDAVFERVSVREVRGVGVSELPSRRLGASRGRSRAPSRLTALPPSTEEIDITPHIERVQEHFERYRRLNLLATLGIFLVGIGLAWFLGVRVTRPVYQVTDGFRRVADGDLEARVPEGRTGEFGLLGRQFNHMVERLRENRELEQELSQRERVQHMGDLAAGVAHDVRNPLNAIHLNIGQIRDEFLPAAERGRERFLRFTSDIQREVERLNQLVTNFLSLARPSAEDQELIDANDLVKELERLLSKEAAGRRVDLRLDLEEDLPLLAWNRQEIKSAFLNIAMNSLQAMEPEGGSLDIITGIRPGDGDGEGDDGMIAVSFVDTGQGIASEDLDRVFMPYFTSREGGTGLGMAIARRITERNGGQMEVRSRLAEGTTVSFLFPPAGTDREGAA